MKPSSHLFLARVGTALFVLSLIALLVILIDQLRTSAKHLVYRKPIVDAIDTLDPIRTRTRADYMIARAIFGQLLKLNEYGEVEAALIDKWEVDPVGKTYSFRIRNDVVFHSGKPATLADVFFTIHYLAQKDSLVSPLFANVEGYDDFVEGRAPELKGVKKTSDVTFTVRLSSPSFIFLLNLADPKMVVLPLEFNQRTRAEFFRHPDGIGPYRLAHLTDDGTELTLVRNEKYFGEYPAISTYQLKKYRKAEAIGAFRHGTLDDLEVFQIGLSDKKDFEDDSQVFAISAYSTALLFMNGKRSLFQDIKVRKFLAGAFDIDYLRSHCEASIVRAHGFIPRGTTGWTEVADAPHVAQESLAAREVARAHFAKEKRPLIFLSYGNENDSCLVRALVEDLEKVTGVPIRRVHVDQDQAVHILKEGNYDFFFESISVRGSDPHTLLAFFSPHSPHNLTKFEDPKILQMSQKILSSPSQVLRTTGYKALDRYIAQDRVYAIPLFSDIRNYVFSKKVKANGIPAIIMMNAGFETVRF